jgi:RNA polymerase sigma-70 factor (ECF subfamily)
MALAQAGDHAAYHVVLDDVRAMLKGFLRRRLTDPEEAADVLQEILMTVHRGRHTYDPSRPFEPWLFSIVRHVIVDHVRRRKRVARVELLGDDDLSAMAAPEAISSSDVLHDALARLPPTQREAFEMLQLEGLSVADAAARAGASPGALRVRAHRAYKALRELLVRS